MSLCRNLWWKEVYFDVRKSFIRHDVENKQLKEENENEKLEKENEKLETRNEKLETRNEKLKIRNEKLEMTNENKQFKKNKIIKEDQKR